MAVADSRFVLFLLQPPRSETKMGHWVKLCLAEQVTSGVPQAFDVESRPLLLCRVDEQVVALKNACSHQSLRMERGGTIDGCILTCPHHSVKYDVTTGEVTDTFGFIGLIPLEMYPVEIRAGEIFVLLPEPG